MPWWSPWARAYQIGLAESILRVMSWASGDAAGVRGAGPEAGADAEASGCPFSTAIHLPDDLVITEVVDPETGRALPPDGPGDLVHTNLVGDTQPLLRHRTRDFARLAAEEPSACGFPGTRVARSIEGRVDDMRWFRGASASRRGRARRRPRRARACRGAAAREPAPARRARAVTPGRRPPRPGVTHKAAGSRLASASAVSVWAFAASVLCWRSPRASRCGFRPRLIALRAL